MLSQLRSRLTYANVVATLGLFVALSTGGAYAANTIGSSDIIDGQVNSADVKDQSLTTFDVSTFLGADVVDGTLTGADVGDGSLTGFDIEDGHIGQVDLADGTVNSAKTADNSLTGTDINESTLSMPPTTTTTFAGSNGFVSVPTNDVMTQIASRSLPAGSYSISATAHASLGGFFAGGDHIVTLYCELRNGNGFSGGATDRRVVPQNDSVDRTLPIVGGAQVPAGGGTVSLWCRSQSGEQVEGQMMITRVDGFF